MPDPDHIIIAVNLKSLLQVKVLTEEGTYVDLEEEKEYSVVKLTNIFLEYWGTLLSFAGDPKLHRKWGRRVQV